MNRLNLAAQLHTIKMHLVCSAMGICFCAISAAIWAVNTANAAAVDALAAAFGTFLIATKMLEKHASFAMVRHDLCRQEMRNCVFAAEGWHLRSLSCSNSPAPSWHKLNSDRTVSS
jgi:hypothetical protein